MTRSRGSKTLRMRIGLAATATTLAAIGWLALGARPADTAPAPRPDYYETAVRGPAGGYEIDLGTGFAAVYATRRPDGGVSVDCTDSETAAAIVYGARP
jgi:hypothetical protein